MPLAGLLALASLACALTLASSTGAFGLSGVSSDGNDSISGSGFFSAPVLVKLNTTAEHALLYGSPRVVTLASDFDDTFLALRGSAKMRRVAADTPGHGAFGCRSRRRGWGEQRVEGGAHRAPLDFGFRTISVRAHHLRKSEFANFIK